MKRLLFVLLLATSACAPVLNVGLNPYVSHVRQREDNDCGTAVMAMASGRSYEEVAKIKARLVSTPVGMVAQDFINVGKEIGVNLLPPVTVYNIATDDGVLIVQLRGSQAWHAVYLFKGDAYDPNQLGPAAAVLLKDQWSVVFLLRRVR